MTGLPEVNDRAVLVRDDGARGATRVEDHDASALAVAAPTGPDWQEAAQEETYELQWPSPRGLCTVRTVLRGTTQGQVPLWWVEPIEEPQLHQRRSFVRAPASQVPGTLTWPARQREVTAGQVMDLSEGGTRVRLDTWLEVGEGEAVEVTIDTEDTSLDLAGHVLRAVDVRGTTEVVVCFGEIPDALATRMRQLLFAWQRRARG